MLTEKDLLLDIIAKTPHNSIWNISEDSWANIPSVIPELKPARRGYGWEVTITKDNRSLLMQLIDHYGIFEKIVHQKIMLEEVCIFKSYDYMASSYISSHLSGVEELIGKYKNCDFGLAKL